MSDDVGWRAARAAAAALALSFAGPAAPAAAVVIDDFEAGAFELLAFDGAEAVLQQGGLSQQRVLFGRREVTMLPAPGSDAVAMLALTQDEDALVVDGELAADLVLAWEPATPASVTSDWTDGGAAERLAIVVSETTHPLQIDGSVTSVAPAVEIRSFSFEAPGPGVYEVAFASLGFGDPAALESVAAFTLAVLPLVEGPGGSVYALSDVRTVPEPESAAVAAIAALALAAGAARRRSRCRSS